MFYLLSCGSVTQNYDLCLQAQLKTKKQTDVAATAISIPSLEVFRSHGFQVSLASLFRVSLESARPS